MRTRRGECYGSPTALCFHHNIRMKKSSRAKPVNGDTMDIDFISSTTTVKESEKELELELELELMTSSRKSGFCRNFGSSDECKEQKIMPRQKRARISTEVTGAAHDFFDALPDDLVVSILSKLSASASCPADFINVLITCRRLNGLGLNSMVLSKASPKTFAIKAKSWSESAHKFLKQCSDAGNVEACYTLGMIRFYCLHNRGSGASLMAKAAINSHAQALYSLAVIQFNGSGGTKSDKDLRAGVALCARAAFLGHVDALRELGHCLQDGYGVRQNIAEGRRFLVQANARELAAALTCSSPSHWLSSSGTSAACPLLSDFGCNVPAPEAHPANRFLSEWFAGKSPSSGGLRLCSHAGCGRPETRRHEFRRCSVCGAVNYCSRACQALDWKLRHKAECAPMERWVVDAGEDNVGNAAVNFDADMGANLNGDAS